MTAGTAGGFVMVCRHLGGRRHAEQ